MASGVTTQPNQKSNQEDEGDGSENDVSMEEGKDDSSSVKENDLIAWKSDLADKASESFYERQSNVTSLRKLVYGTVDTKDASGNIDGDDDQIGGMFRVLAEGQAKKSDSSSVMDQVKF
jgi:hypothetical protein